MDEREIIKNLFVNLATNPGALNLDDDAAFLAADKNKDSIITQDTLISGVHFHSHDSPYNIAKKAIRVNVSDLIAKGATPYVYFLSIGIPKNINTHWLELFASGLKDDQEKYSISLLGGDTVSSPNDIHITINMVGLIPKNKMVRRSGANINDNLYVSGCIGDSALGLSILDDVSLASNLSAISKNYLIDSYYLPDPPIDMIRVINDFATSSMDVSDGLLGDIKLLIKSSSVSAKINLKKIPVSLPANELINNHTFLFQKAINAGDDYQVLFTVPVDKIKELESYCCSNNLIVTNIGSIIKTIGENELFDEFGKSMIDSKERFKHF